VVLPVGVTVTIPPGWDELDCCSHGLGRFSTALLPGLAVPEARRCSHGLGGAGRPDIVVCLSRLFGVARVYLIRHTVEEIFFTSACGAFCWNIWPEDNLIVPNSVFKYRLRVWRASNPNVF